MPTSTAIGYNTGSTIVGTQQIGNLAVVTATTANPSLSPNGVKFWMGPDQDLGYVIGVPVSGGTQPTPIQGLNAFLGFYRSSSLTDSSFLSLVNSTFNQNFTTASGATNYLSSNGYWTNYVASTGQVYRIYNSDPSLSLTYTYTQKDGSSATTDPIAPSGHTYILASGGSLSDSVDGSLAITDLIITSDIQETPSFTETLITTTGSGSWTKPTGVTQVVVECWAGGAAGGGATTDGQDGSGGAGGGFARKFITYSSPSSSITYNVAASVAGTTGNGASGNTTTWATNICVAKGGTGGLANSLNAGGGGSAATDNVGDIVHNGTGGGNAFGGKSGNLSGVGGSSYGSTGNVTGLEYGGGGGTYVGPGVGITNSNGNPGNSYGGGGSGADRQTTTNRSGGGGAQGLIRIIYR